MIPADLRDRIMLETPPDLDRLVGLRIDHRRFELPAIIVDVERVRIDDVERENSIHFKCIVNAPECSDLLLLLEQMHDAVEGTEDHRILTIDRIKVARPDFGL